MQTQEIPSDQWGPFLDNLSRRHEGEPVSIEIEGRDIGVQPEGRNVQLIGITFDPKDSIGQEIDVIITDSDETKRQMMHAVTHPSRVQIARSDDGRDTALQLESKDGPTTLVRFGIGGSEQQGGGA
jgi:hypothetical protein